jgi:hypothetical protein
VVYLTMPSVAHTIQHQMAELNKQWIRLSMEGNRHGLIWGTILVFVWR